MDVIIRQAVPADDREIEAVVHAAFGETEGIEIAGLISDLMQDPTAAPILPLVAVTAGRITGHILFTRATISNARQEVSAALLAPLAVRPGHQRQGVGGLLIRKGLERLRASAVELVFVLGHPQYYPRHGFVTAGVQGFDAPYPIPDRNAEAWMVMVLQPRSVDRCSGRVVCADALMNPAYWVE